MIGLSLHLVLNYGVCTSFMKHLRTISRNSPAKAQFEPVIQLVVLARSVLDLLDALGSAFNVDLTPDKQQPM